MTSSDSARFSSPRESSLLSRAGWQDSDGLGVAVCHSVRAEATVEVNSEPRWRGPYASPPYSAPDENVDAGRVQFRRTERTPPARPRGPKGYRRSDARIEEDVVEQLQRADRIDASEVALRVQNGTVQLAGTVPERWMKYTIEDLARDCHGVQDVDNRIRVPRNVE